VSPVGGNGALSRVRVRERPEAEKEASGGGALSHHQPVVVRVVVAGP
jgi:hypothetical protein